MIRDCWWETDTSAQVQVFVLRQFSLTSGNEPKYKSIRLLPEEAAIVADIIIKRLAEAKK